MAVGVGGSSAEIELSNLSSMRDRVAPIGIEEYQCRLQKLRGLMAESQVDAFYLDATSSLRYFTGMYCYPSERLHGAIITASELYFICPAFEEEKTRAGMLVEGEFVLWQEHESPTEIVASHLLKLFQRCKLAIDDQTPFFTADGLQQASEKLSIVNGGELIAKCRRIKSIQRNSAVKAGEGYYDACPSGRCWHFGGRHGYSRCSGFYR